MNCGDLVKIEILNELAGTGMVLDVDIFSDRYRTILCNGRTQVLPVTYMTVMGTLTDDPDHGQTVSTGHGASGGV